MTDPAEPNKEIRDFAHYATLGLQFGLTILVFCVLGYFVDRWLDTTPAGLLLGILLGSSAAFWKLYRTVFPLGKSSKSSEKEKGP